MLFCPFLTPFSSRETTTPHNLISVHYTVLWLLTALQFLLLLTSVMGHCWLSRLPLIFLLYFNSWLLANNSHYNLSYLTMSVFLWLAFISKPLFHYLLFGLFNEIRNLLKNWLVGLYFCCLFFSSRRFLPCDRNSIMSLLYTSIKLIIDTHSAPTVHVHAIHTGREMMMSVGCSV